MLDDMQCREFADKLKTQSVEQLELLLGINESDMKQLNSDIQVREDVCSEAAQRHRIIKQAIRERVQV